MKHMQAREAKAKFAELLQTAERGESVTITRHGKPVARIVPIDDAAEKEAAEREKDRKFIEHLLAFPGPLEIERDRRPSREIDL